jgi:hypothetical protein
VKPVRNPGVCGLAFLSLNNLAKHEKREKERRGEEREILGAHTP